MQLRLPLFASLLGAVVGLSSTAPGPIGQHALIFSGGTPGTYKVYLDNLRIRHADGSKTSLWVDHTQTRARSIEDSAAFKTVRVRAISLSEVQAGP